MGMFDYISCEMPLPDPKPTGVQVFQTKDTPDQYMTTYTITADGRLTWRPYTMEEVPREERPYTDAEKGSLLALCGSIRCVESDPEDIAFHGDIYFYTDSDRQWFEYRARFTEGRCTSIILSEYIPAQQEDRTDD